MLSKDSIIPFLFLPVSSRVKNCVKVRLNQYDFEFGIRFDLILEKKENTAPFFLLSNQVITEENHIFYKKLIENITDQRFLRMLTQRKIFIQNKGFLDIEEEFAEVIRFDFEKIEEGFVLNASLVLTFEILELLKKIFQQESTLDELEKKIYYFLSNPAADFSKYILKLPDSKLQLLLNHILHKKIASVDMLASYIRNLGKDGERLLDNLSTRVGKEVEEKMKSGRIFSTYRWAEEVTYIINRNLLFASRELEVSLPFFERFEIIRKSYEIAVLKKQLLKKPFSEWLLEFSSSREKMREFINSVSRNDLINSLTFVEERLIVEIFSMVISQNGIKLLIEDVRFAYKRSEEERFLSLYRVIRVMKDIYYFPLTERVDFEDALRKYVKNPEALELVVDEIGFAKAIFALKGVKQDILEPILKGVLRKIYEDVISGKIIIKEHYDSRIEEYRKDFIKALLILSDEEKI